MACTAATRGGKMMYRESFRGVLFDPPPFLPSLPSLPSIPSFLPPLSLPGGLSGEIFRENKRPSKHSKGTTRDGPKIDFFLCQSSRGCASPGLVGRRDFTRWERKHNVRHGSGKGQLGGGRAVQRKGGAPAHHNDAEHVFSRGRETRAEHGGA